MGGALLLQVGVNLANDYFDFVTGIDTEERIGPLRVTQSGLIQPSRVRAGMILSFGLAAVLGLYLVLASGWPVVVIGATSILAALLYSGGPYPLASHGLGDLFAFIFFGFVAVCGTYYVQALQITRLVFLMAIPVGLLITAILVVNNLRDIPTDQKLGKRTLAVILGPRRARTEYILLLAGAYAVPLLTWLTGLVSAWILLPLLSLPLAVAVTRIVVKNADRVLNQALAATARLTLIFCFLLSLGLALPSLSLLPIFWR
jgi:1,4-dihydroxy-2-naphthoate octaprenyltransferase